MKDSERPTLNTLSPNHQPGHPQTVAIFQALAEGFNVQVTQEHRRYWRSMLTVGRAIDSVVDDQQPSSLQVEYDLLAEGLPIEGMSTSEAEEFSDIIQSISPERRQAILDGMRINDYAEQMRNTRGYRQFFTLRTEEAEVFGRIMQLDNPDDVPSITFFNAWLPKFARAGYLIDSFGDFTQDYKDGQIALRPTLSRRLKIAGVALAETRQAASDLPPRTIAFLAVASLSKMARNGLSKIKQ